MKKIQFIEILCIILGFPVFMTFTTLVSSEVIDEIVAIVNNDIITLSDVRKVDINFRIFLSQKFQGEELRKEIEKTRESILVNLIEKKLLYQEAKEENLTFEAELTSIITNIMKENNLENERQLAEAMSREGIKYEEWKKEMEINILQEKLIRKRIDTTLIVENAELLDYYKNHQAEFRIPAEVYVKGIFLKNSDNVESLKKEIEEKLKEESFENVASMYSQGPEKDKGGDLGSFKKGEMEKSLDEAIFSSNVGDVTQWIKVPNGWYKIKLESKKEEGMEPFEETREEIYNKILEVKRMPALRKYIESLKKKAYIKILIPNPFEKID
ncbi:MAG: peptidyl-prolyl cis-trans isomerase [Acidobacteriota bacterium]